MVREEVILVDENDGEIGTEEKLEAHRQGKLHRAFSIFIFNSQGNLLLQKRSRTKYHSDGLWTNTCCSHPRPGTQLLEEAKRKLFQEMGFECEVRKIFDFTYRVEFPNQLIEHEIDHVLIGRYDQSPVPAPEEVEDWKWMEVHALHHDLNLNPEKYSYWLKICFDRVLSFLPLVTNQ